MPIQSTKMPLGYRLKANQILEWEEYKIRYSNNYINKHIRNSHHDRYHFSALCKSLNRKTDVLEGL